MTESQRKAMLKMLDKLEEAYRNAGKLKDVEAVQKHRQILINKK